MMLTTHLLRTWGLVLAMAGLVPLSACNGTAGPETLAAPQASAPQVAAAQALRQRALAVSAQAVATSVVVPEEAALQLLDFAEARFPAFFPSRQPTRSLSPFVYRFYPQTGIHLGVVVMPGLGYEYGGVYVMGGSFGAAPLFVGPLTAFVTPQPVRSEWLVGGVGDDSASTAETTVQYFDFARTLAAPHLVVVDRANPSRWQRVERSGVAATQAQIFAADVDATTTETRRLRERWRTYWRNGRLQRLDLEPPTGQVPAALQLSSLSALALCADDQQVFQNWPDPARAWLVFPAPAEGVDNCYSARSYRAVRLGMAATDAPLTLSGRPVDAVRDARGAIEGFIVHDAVADRVLLTDAEFRTQRVLVEAGRAGGPAEVEPHGVYGRGAGRYLLYRARQADASEQMLALPLAEGGSTRTVASTRLSDAYVAEDGSGAYMIAERLLLHIDPSLNVRVLTRSLPITDGRLFLTPTRVVMIAGNIAPQSVVVVPKAGGDPAVVAALSGQGGAKPNVAVVGEDIYVQRHQLSGVLIVASDGSRLQGPIDGFIAAPLRPVSWFQNQAPSGVSLNGTRTAEAGAEGAAAVLLIEGSSLQTTTLSGASVVRYDEGRVRRVLGRLPDDGVRSIVPVAQPEAADVSLTGGSAVHGRSIGLHQIGQVGLLYERFISIVPAGRTANLWWIDPAGALAPIDVTGTWP